MLASIILENIETLRHYQNIKDEKGNVVEDTLQFVSNVITNLPWYFRLPVIILASLIGLLCFIATGHKLNMLSSEKRSSFLQHVKVIPFYGMLNKLVRSMAFLKLFDILPMAPDYLNSANCERH